MLFKIQWHRIKKCIPLLIRWNWIWKDMILLKLNGLCAQKCILLFDILPLMAKVGCKKVNVLLLASTKKSSKLNFSISFTFKIVSKDMNKKGNGNLFPHTHLIIDNNPIDTCCVVCEDQSKLSLCCKTLLGKCKWGKGTRYGCKSQAGFSVETNSLSLFTRPKKDEDFLNTPNGFICKSEEARTMFRKIIYCDPIGLDVLQPVTSKGSLSYEATGLIFCMKIAYEPYPKKLRTRFLNFCLVAEIWEFLFFLCSAWLCMLTKNGG